MAAWNGFPEIVEVMMEQGGSELLLHQDERGWTCLFRATEQGHQSVMSLLLQRGGQALLEMRDKNDVTCVDLAHTLWGEKSLHSRPQLIRLLVEDVLPDTVM